MSVFRHEEMVCPLCGKTFSTAVVMSYSVNGSLRSLDGDPHEPVLFDTVHLCPYCGYAFSDQKEEPDAFTPMLVRGENYRTVFEAEDLPDTAKKLLLRSFLAEQKGDLKEAGNRYLQAYWYFRDNDLPEKEEAREKAIEAMERYLEANADLESAMVLVDLLRQKGAFDEALETVNSLGKYLRGEEVLLKVAAFEWKLIMAENSKNAIFEEIGA